MAYPLIILGAGASYDYSPSGGLGRIAPLTKDLAEDKFFHPGFLDRYRGAGNLFLEMIYQVRSNKRGFEEALTEFLKKSKNSIEMQRRFVSLEFYLRELFNQIKNGKNEESPPIHEKEFNINSERKHFCLFPALAIPLIGKHKYICPERHIRELEQNLKKVDRILIIGWRAEDPALLETIKRYLPPEMSYKVLVVSGTLEGAKKIAKKVQQGLGIVNEFY